MPKIFFALFFLLSFNSFSQTNDLRLDTTFQRSGVGGHYETGLTYYKYSAWESMPINFSGIITNTGSNDLTGCHLLVTIEDEDGEITATLSSDTITLNTGDSDSLWISEFNSHFLSYGHNTLIFSVVSDSIDATPLNNIRSSTFSIQNESMSRSNGIIEDTFLLGSGPIEPYFQIGNTYELIHDFYFQSISFPVIDTALNIGARVWINTFKYNPITEEWNYLCDNSWYQITEADLGSELHLRTNYCGASEGDLILITLNCIDSLLIGLAQKADLGTVFHETYLMEIDTAENPRVVVMDIEFLTSTGAIDEKALGTIFFSQNSPNPFQSTTTISYELTTSENVSITITDLKGRIIQTIEKRKQATGTKEITLDTQNWETGTYFYTISIGKQQETRQMLKVK